MKSCWCHQRLALLFVVALSACSSDSENTHPNATIEELYPDGCDPIVTASYCGYPFPSDVFTTEDPSSPTGRRVRFHRTRMMPPRYVEGDGTPRYQDPTLFDDFDGFSPGAELIFNLPNIDLAGTATVTNVARSLEPDSPTVVLDAETGERIPHFVEADPRPYDTSRRMVLIRPVRRLDSAHRYVVAVRRLVDAYSGAPIEPTEAFAALRDGRRFDAHASVAHRRSRYESMFDLLEEHGVARDDLQLAWDFTTSSDAHNTERMVSMIEAGLAELGANAPSYTITSVGDNPDGNIARRIEGTVRVPMYLTGTGGTGSTMVLDANGMPLRTGFVDVPFLLQIPVSAVGTSAANPKPILQHGHGLFGSRTEADSSSFRSFVDANGYVILSMDWWGLSGSDFTAAAALAQSGDIRDFRTIPDRGQQAMLNFMYGLRAVTRGLATASETQINGFPTIDVADPRYMGVSLGGIYGSVYLTLSPDIDRGVLMVPGQPFSLLLPRNGSTFPALHTLFVFVSLLDEASVPLGMGLVQMLWDRSEPDGYTHLMLDDPDGVLPFASNHHVFVMDAIGDKTVTTIGAQIMARTIGIPLLAPNPRPVFGMMDTVGPIEGSAFAEFDFGPTESTTQIPNPMGSDPHSALISESSTSAIPRAMAAQFLGTGTVTNLCMDSCDPN